MPEDAQVIHHTCHCVECDDGLRELETVQRLGENHFAVRFGDVSDARRRFKIGRAHV